MTIPLLTGIISFGTNSMIFQKELNLPTSGPGHVQDLSSRIQKLVTESGITTGIVNIFNVGSTGGIGLIEFEPGLEEDLPALLNRIVPPNGTYAHQLTWHDNNGHSHLQATLLGQTVCVPIKNGQLAINTWQQIVHTECDIKPRERSILITITGE